MILDIFILLGVGLMIFLFRQHLKASKAFRESRENLARSIREWESKEDE